jgi:hypothetical protein
MLIRLVTKSDVLAAGLVGVVRFERSERGALGTARERSAQLVPNLLRFLGTVRGLFRRGETPSPLLLTGRNLCFSEAKMVGAAGIEPATPTMST